MITIRISIPVDVILTKTTSPEINPCPFCGSKLRVDTESPDGNHIFVECRACSAQGPIENDRNYAIKRWNAAQGRKS